MKPSLRKIKRELKQLKKKRANDAFPKWLFEYRLQQLRIAFLELTKNVEEGLKELGFKKFGT